MNGHWPLLCWAWLISVGVFSLYGQGSIVFANRSVGSNVDAPVFHIDCVTPLEGPGFLAQLYAGTQGASENQLAAVGEPVPFMSGPAAGYFSGGMRTVPFVAPGQVATLQVRAWEATAVSYEKAREGLGLFGKSALIDAELTGLFPPGQPAALSGLKSFCLIPEPLPISLILIGATCLVLCRSSKINHSRRESK